MEGKKEGGEGGGGGGGGGGQGEKERERLTCPIFGNGIFAFCIDGQHITSYHFDLRVEVSSLLFL
jgi:hypothetical protein